MRHRFAFRGVSMPYKDHVRGLLGQYQVGIVLYTALAGLALMFRHLHYRWLLFRHFEPAVGHDIECGLDRNDPDLGSVPITHPGAFSSERRAVVHLPHDGNPTIRSVDLHGCAGDTLHT